MKLPWFAGLIAMVALPAVSQARWVGGWGFGFGVPVPRVYVAPAYSYYAPPVVAAPAPAVVAPAPVYAAPPVVYDCSPAVVYAPYYGGAYFGWGGYHHYYGRPYFHRR